MSKRSSVGLPKIKRLFWDIETAPNVVYSWRIGFNINLSIDNIINERKIICIAWKWEHENEVHLLHWDKNHDDKAMLREFLDVANEADEMIAHYGDGFDMPWFKARCLIHGLEPLPLYKTVDTKAWASKYFYFNSNKLDYLGGVLGHGHKHHTDFQLWIDVIHDKPGALAYMCRYCKRDITLLQKVWNRLRFCVRPKTHVGVMEGRSKWTCAHCGSSDVKVSKRRVTSTGSVSYQMVCNDCGGYFTISSKAYEGFLKEKSKAKKA